MLVFLRNIPDRTCYRDIVNFVSPALRGGLFTAKGSILSINALLVKDDSTGLVEHHAIVHIKPDAAALRAMKKLNGQFFKGRRIALHEYVVRSWKNDRRTPGNAKPGALLANRRLNATRRRNVQAKMGRFLANAEERGGAEGNCSAPKNL